MGGLRYVDWQQQTLPFAAAELGLTSHPAKVILILCTRSYMYSATFVALIFTYICFFKKEIYSQSYLSLLVHNGTTRWQHNIIYDKTSPTLYRKPGRDVQFLSERWLFWL